jgi:hypothetical protein
MRSALAHAGRTRRSIAAALIATAVAQDDAEAAGARRRLVADQIRPEVAKPAAFMDEAEADMRAGMTFPLRHRTTLH